MQTAEQVRLPEVPPGAPTWGPHPGGPVQGTLSWGVCHGSLPPPHRHLWLILSCCPCFLEQEGLGKGTPSPLSRAPQCREGSRQQRTGQEARGRPPGP